VIIFTEAARVDLDQAGIFSGLVVFIDSRRIIEGKPQKIENI
jgi:hypothetical protein